MKPNKTTATTKKLKDHIMALMAASLCVFLILALQILTGEFKIHFRSMQLQ